MPRLLVMWHLEGHSLTLACFLELRRVLELYIKVGQLYPQIFLKARFLPMVVTISNLCKCEQDIN